MVWEKLSPPRKSSIVLPVSLSLVWICLVIAGARVANFNEPYLPFAVASGLAFFLRSKPQRWEIYAWLLIAALLVKVIHLPEVPFWILRVAASMALFGFAAILMLGLRLLWSEAEGRENASSLLAPALILIVFIYGCARVLSLTSGLSPLTYDAWLYALDGSLGFQPSFSLGRIMYDSTLLTRSALLTYLSLPFAMGVVCAWNMPAGARKISWRMLTVILIAGVAGWLLYNVVPGTGPIYAFAADFPWQNLSYHELSGLALQKMSLPTTIPRNAMPSLHVAWVTLMFWNSRKFPAALRAAVLAFLILTVIATLGSGQHYLVDLVVSLPFALTVQALASFLLPEKSILARSRRIRAAAAGFAVTMAWLLLVRFGVSFALQSPAIPWTIIAATVTATLWLKSWALDGESPSIPEMAEASRAAAEHPVATGAAL
jgi:hypothetical protein